MFYFTLGVVAGIALHPLYIKYVKPVLVERGYLREREPDSSASSS